MINKRIFKRPRVKYGIIGLVIGILTYIYGIFAYSTKSGEFFINSIISLPFQFYLKLFKLFNLCPRCVDEVFGLAIVTMPIFICILGYLIGLLIEKLRDKK